MQIKNRQKFLGIAAIVGLVLLAGDNLVVSPLIASWNAREVRITELSKKIEQGKQLQARRATIEERWSKMRRSTFPSTQSQAENAMLKAFDRWAQDSHITVSSIKPQWKQTDEDYTTLICRADATGNMDTISRFLYEVEKDPLALKVEAVEITSHDNDGQQLSLGLQVSGLLLTPQQP